MKKKMKGFTRRTEQTGLADDVCDDFVDLVVDRDSGDDRRTIGRVIKMKARGGRRQLPVNPA